MDNLTIDNFIDWLEENEVDYLATRDNDIVFNDFKDIRIDYNDEDQVLIYIKNHHRHKIFELDSTDFSDIRIF